MAERPWRPLFTFYAYASPDGFNHLLEQKDPIAYNNDVVFPDKVKMNLNYYENNNIWIDIKIIFATLFTLFK